MFFFLESYYYHIIFGKVSLTYTNTGLTFKFGAIYTIYKSTLQFTVSNPDASVHATRWRNGICNYDLGLGST